MGGLPKPTAVLDAQGSYIKHPGRRRPDEPKTDRPLGPPPKWLSEDEKRLWREISKKILPGVAFESDREAFEMMVRLTYRMRTDFANMQAAERTQLINLWSRFAMTPADRCKVQVSKPKESKLDKFLNRSASKPVVPQQTEVPLPEVPPSVPPVLAN